MNECKIYSTKTFFTLYDLILIFSKAERPKVDVLNRADFIKLMLLVFIYAVDKGCQNELKLMGQPKPIKLIDLM